MAAETKWPDVETGAQGLATTSTHKTATMAGQRSKFLINSYAVLCDQIEDVGMAGSEIAYPSYRMGNTLQGGVLDARNARLLVAPPINPAGAAIHRYTMGQQDLS